MIYYLIVLLFISELKSSLKSKISIQTKKISFFFLQFFIYSFAGEYVCEVHTQMDAFIWAHYMNVCMEHRVMIEIGLNPCLPNSLRQGLTI